MIRIVRCVRQSWCELYCPVSFPHISPDSVTRFRENDVSGIDVNMGCPKDFSLKGGMGAALLTQPEKVRAILTKLVTGLSIPVTCKIRILPDIEDTIVLAKVIESTGVAALAVHGRTKMERPKDKNNDTAIRQVVDAVRIPVIANGGSDDIKCYEDIEKFRRVTGASSVMLARASESNPSIFRKEGMLPLDDVIRSFMRYSILFDNHVANVKYVVQHMLSSLQASGRGQQLISASELKQIYAIWNMDAFYEEVREQRNREKIYKSSGYSLLEERSIKRFKREEGGEEEDEDGGKSGASGSNGKENASNGENDVTEECIQFLKSRFRPDSMPKQLLNNFSNYKLSIRPEYRTMVLERKFYTEVRVEGRKFRSTFLEKNKRNAEQAAALIACLHYHLIEREAVADCILTAT